MFQPRLVFIYLSSSQGPAILSLHTERSIYKNFLLDKEHFNKHTSPLYIVALAQLHRRQHQLCMALPSFPLEIVAENQLSY